MVGAATEDVTAAVTIRVLAAFVQCAVAKRPLYLVNRDGQPHGT